MASTRPNDNNNTQDHEQERKESGQSSPDRDGDGSPRAGGHPPASVYHPPMGYPPSMGYPPGQYPYSGGPGGYPNYNNGYSTGFPFAQPPPGTSYYPTEIHGTQTQRQISGFVRGIVGGFLFLLIFVCIISVITWLILRPTIPLFNVNDLSVSNFNTSSSLNFTATWDVNITVVNPNTKLKVYFDQIEVFMYYKEDDLLATSFENPFFMETKMNSTMMAKLEADNADRKQTGVGNWVVESMAKEISNKGNLTFDMKMALWSTFKSGTWWTKHLTVRVYCEDLIVSFVGNSTTTAKFANGKPKDCLAFA